MAKFAIRISETLARTVIVDSDDLDEAMQKVENAVSESEQTALRFGIGLMKNTRKGLQNYQAAPNR